MARSYEELVGSLGRSVYFRPERKRVRDLLSRSANPRLEVNGVEHPLFDVASTGASFLVKGGGEQFERGQQLEVSLRLRDAEVFRGPARVARVEPSAKSTLVGVALVKGFLDLPQFLWHDEEQALQAALSGDPINAYDLVPEDYRRVIGKVVNFIQQYRLVLDKHEQRYLALGAAGVPLIESLTRDALEKLREPWLQLEHEASAAADACLQDATVLDAAKRMTEACVTPLLMQAPMVARSYNKPLGYPGDYKVMNYYYANIPEGPCVSAKVFHKYFVEHPLSNGVRTRKDFLVSLTKQHHDQVTSQSAQRPFAAMSLGCGPAREVRDFVVDTKAWRGDIAWTLIDQEDEALSLAFNETHRVLSTSAGHGSVDCLHLAFSQLLNDPSVLPIREQDLIYSAGLFDYLSEKRAQQLIRGLWDRLAPGGLLAVGNAKGPNNYYWSPEFVLDWTLLYRTEAEMRTLTELLPSTASYDVVLEPGEAYYFLLIRKP